MYGTVHGVELEICKLRFFKKITVLNDIGGESSPFLEQDWL